MRSIKTGLVFALLGYSVLSLGCGKESATSPGPTPNPFIKPISGKLEVPAQSTVPADRLDVVTFSGWAHLAADGRFTVNCTASEDYQLLMFSLHADSLPVYLGLYDPIRNSATASDTSTALALTMFNFTLPYADVETKAQYFAAVRQQAEFRELVILLKTIYQDNAARALDYAANPRVYELAVEAAMKAMEALGGQNFSPQAMALTNAPPHLEDLPGPDVKFVNPYHCWYAAGVYKDATTLKEVVMLNRKEAIASIKWGIPPEIVFLGDANTTYGLGDGYFQINIDKGGDVSKIADWNDPVGKATAYNLMQVGVSIMEIVAGKVPGKLNFNDLFRHLNFKQERLSQLAIALSANDPVGLVSAGCDWFLDNTEAFALWYWENNPTNAKYQWFLTQGVELVKTVTFVSEFLGFANDQGPFILHLVNAPKKVTYWAEQKLGVLTVLDYISLEPPQLKWPADGANLTIRRPTFQWFEVAQATKYDLQVSRNSNMSEMVINCTETGTQYTPDQPLAPDVTYYWRVRACKDNPTACGGWSGTWSLTISSLPAGTAFSESFESYPLGGLPEGSIWDVNVTPPTILEIVQNGYEQQGLKVADPTPDFLDTEGGSTADIIGEVPAEYAEVEFYIFVQSSSFDFEIRAVDDELAYWSTMSWALVFMNGAAYYASSWNDPAFVKIIDLQPGRWYRFELYVNWNDYTYTIYVDGAFVTAAAFFYPAYLWTPTGKVLHFLEPLGNQTATDGLILDEITLRGNAGGVMSAQARHSTRPNPTNFVLFKQEPPRNSAIANELKIMHNESINRMH